MHRFPTMKSKKLLAILMRKPLSYFIVRSVGSHKTLSSTHYRTIHFSFHESRELSGSEVRDVIVNQVGLNIEFARRVIK